jgi:GTP-binding protein
LKIESAEFCLSAHSVGDFPRDELPEVAFLGRSNVGKSSLLNRLLGRRGLARISSTPGRTQAINYFRVNRRSYFVDLPGYGYARASRTDREAWGKVVEKYLRFSADRLLGVLLVDGNVGATASDIEAHAYLTAEGVQTVVVATKMDRVTRGRWRAVLAEVRATLKLKTTEIPVLGVSAKTGDGIQDLWRHLDAHVGKHP